MYHDKYNPFTFYSRRSVPPSTPSSMRPHPLDSPQDLKFTPQATIPAPNTSLSRELRCQPCRRGPNSCELRIPAARDDRGPWRRPVRPDLACAHPCSNNISIPSIVTQPVEAAASSGVSRGRYAASSTIGERALSTSSGRVSSG